MNTCLTLDRTDYLTEEELSSFLGVNCETLRKWRSMQKGPAFVKFGRRPLYPKQEVLDWMKGQIRNGDRAQRQTMVFPVSLARKGTSRTYRFGSHQGKHGARERAREAA